MLRRTSLSILILALGASAQANEPRKLLFADDFESRSEVGSEYTYSSAYPNAWSVANGVLVGKQDNPGHGAVIRKNIDFHNVDMEMDFRFNGGLRFNFVFDDQNEKSVWASHICRVSLSHNSIKISDDKTGSMNLEVRKMRQDENLSAAKKKELTDLLERTSSSAKIDLAPGQWHRLRVLIKGPTMEVYIAGKLVTSLTSPGIDHPTKSKVGMTVTGTSIDFDNLKLFSVSK